MRINHPINNTITFPNFFPNVVLKGQKLNAERHFAKIFLVFVIFICLIVLTFPFLLFAHSIAFLYKLIFFLVENLQVKCNLTSFWAKKNSQSTDFWLPFCWSSLFYLFFHVKRLLDFKNLSLENRKISWIFSSGNFSFHPENNAK